MGERIEQECQYKSMLFCQNNFTDKCALLHTLKSKCTYRGPQWALRGIDLSDKWTHLRIKLISYQNAGSSNDLYMYSIIAPWNGTIEEVYMLPTLILHYDNYLVVITSVRQEIVTKLIQDNARGILMCKSTTRKEYITSRFLEQLENTETREREWK